MQNKRHVQSSLCTLLSALVLVLPSVAKAAASSIEHSFEADLAIVGNSETEGEGTRFDSGEETTSRISYVLSPQVSSRVLLHFGAEWQRSAFDVPDPAPVPATLHKAVGIIGVDWQFHDKWLFRASVRPGVYSDLEEVTWRDVNAPILLGAVYLAAPDLQWFMGFRIDPFSEYVVIPAVGVRWKFQENWTLNAVFPQPRIEYDIRPGFKAYLGGSFETGAYRVGQNFGSENGWPELNGETLSFFEARIGPGVSWKATSRLDLSLDAGYTVLRRFDYSDRDRVFKSDPAPYARLSAKFEF